jgi:ABC-type cobalamin/Fe3+-siderophores transport system ATPase subunit
MSIIERIQLAKQRGIYSRYIDYIRYPKYKNLINNTKITFDFPITVLVGKNGSGKSSVLKSLYGCIDGKNISDYWFSTNIDPIEEGDGENRNCFIYNYPSADIEYEVLVQRINREGNPDYWETSRPVARYGMQRDASNENYRKPKLNTNLVYIDFHSVLSAFDKYRYFLGPESITQGNKYLRSKSRYLHRVFEENTIIHSGKGNKEQNSSTVELNANELREISQILGKTYTNATIVEHKFFKLWGQSVLFRNNELSYSEAFAGSGENAVVTLVKKIINAPRGSVILLDEPETCLHPGAQKRIFDFLLNECLTKQQQIIISTHSKEFVKELPNNAIKVFNELPNGSIEVLNECNPSSAFFYLGEDIVDKKTVIVEDKLSQEIIISIAKLMGDDIASQLNVQFPSGGSKEIKKNIAWYTKLQENNKYIILDGDELLNDGVQVEIFNPDNLRAIDRNVDYLETIIQRQTKINDLKFFTFNSNETAENKITAYINYLIFFRDNVKFLPGITPEEMIWNDDIAFSIRIIDDATINLIRAENNYKNKFSLLANAIYRENNSNVIFTTQKMFITQWLKDNTNTERIQAIINEIID